MDRQQTFLWRYLDLFSQTLAGIERQIDGLPELFDPSTAPASFLPWLASWLALSLNENWDEPKRRRLIQNISRLYKERGLPEGVATFVEIYTGYRPDIIEHIRAGMKIGVRSKIGVNTKLYEGGQNGDVFKFTVQVNTPEPESVDIAELREIIDQQKPSWSRYYLVIPDNQFMQLEVRSTIGADTILGV